jgi:hypothetical protein
MEVSVSYADPADTLIVAEVRDALTRLVKTDDERNMLSDPDLMARIETNAKKAGQPRVRNVIYNVDIFDVAGMMVDSITNELNEADLLFGST